MQQIYLSENRVKALRFLNFLAQQGIDAELRDEAANAPDSERVGSSAGTSLWVQDANVARAEALRKEFLTLSRLAGGEEKQPGEGNDGETEAPLPGRRLFPWLTLLLGVTCLLFSVGLWRDDPTISLDALRRWGWRDSLAVADGSWWSILTSHFLHQNLDHLVINLLMLLPLSAGIERASGRWTWLGLFLSAILASAAAELAGRGEQGYGASGILFAFFGFALVASFRVRIVPVWLLVPLTLWLVPSALSDLAHVMGHLKTGKFAPSLPSFYSHVAGLAIGILYGGAFAISWQPWVMRGVMAAALVAALIPLRGSPWLANWHLARAQKAIEEHHVPEAIDHFTRAIERDPQAAYSYLGRGFQLMLDGRLDEALADFDAAAALDSKVEDIRAYQSLMFSLRSEVDKAYELANENVRSGGAGAVGYSTRGSLLLEMGRPDAAVRDYAVAIERVPRATEYWSSRAVAHLLHYEYDAAISDADHAVWLDPKDGAAHFYRGLAGLKSARDENAREKATVDIRDGRELLMRALEHFPRDVFLRGQLADVDRELFEIDKNPLWLDEAITHAEQAVSIAPRFWIAYSNRSHIELARQEFESSDRDASRALELYSRDYFSAWLRGEARLKLNRPADALRDFDTALEVKPRFADARLGRGKARLELGQTQQAVDDLSAAIDLDPGLGEAYALRGKTRIALGEKDAGEADLSQARRIDPSLAESGAP